MVFKGGSFCNSLIRVTNLFNQENRYYNPFKRNSFQKFYIGFPFLNTFTTRFSFHDFIPWCAGLFFMGNTKID